MAELSYTTRTKIYGIIEEINTISKRTEAVSEDSDEYREARGCLESLEDLDLSEMTTASVVGLINSLECAVDAAAFNKTSEIRVTKKWVKNVDQVLKELRKLDVEE